MNFYIAARFSLKDQVNEISAEIKKYKHTVISTWIRQKDIKPYDKNLKRSSNNSIKCLKQVKDCDVFVLISDKEGTGMYIELGIAMLSKELFNRPKIYVIGKHLSRSMFFFHPSITRKENIKEVLNHIDKS